VSKDIIIPPPNIASGKFYLTDIVGFLKTDEVFSRELKPVVCISKASLYPVYPWIGSAILFHILPLLSYY